ncbi:major facilitator superfamily protein [Klebsormidium nitens]|uniref:Major facilitator superfamily protein n=1 Tax=Klebsormidium nitens TaxID=105231 RepID=A0A1Y1HXI0_KLENI|nr:major facilitator superfamily protein [Klebsormidium nitens]|eukprot:GAQ82472.1 major facilitator superfamily protein [Klebsormidium nitens]
MFELPLLAAGSPRQPPAYLHSWRSVLLLLVFVDLMAAGMVMSMLVPLMKELGATPFQLGLISSTYGALQLTSGPMVGLLSDRKGRHFIIVAAYLGTAIGYGLVGFSRSLEVLFLSRVITGLVRHSSNGVKAYISDRVSRSERSVDFGRMATASGLGFMVGPMLGGFLHRYGGQRLPGCLAALLFLCNATLASYFLPAFPGPTSDKGGPESPFPSPLPPRIRSWHARLESVLPQAAVLRRPKVGALLAVRAVLGLAVQVFREGFTTLVLYRFELDARQNGMLISYQGFLTTLVQGFAIRPLVASYPKEGFLIQAGITSLGLAYVAASLGPSIRSLVVLLAPVALAGGVVRTTFTALLTSAVPSSEVGQLLGLADTLMSTCRVLGPTLAGLLVTRLGTTAPGFVSGMLVLLAGVLFRALGCGQPSPRKEKDIP